MKRQSSRLSRALRWLATIVSASGLLLTAFTFLPLPATLGASLTAIMIFRTRLRAVLLIATMLGCVAFRLGANANLESPAPIAFSQPGQYTAGSSDLLKLVSVRAVIRARAPGNVLVFIEANTLPFSGLDTATLKREIYRTLEAQTTPAKPHPESDPLTAGLYYSALAAAMHPTRQPEIVECPKGISAPDNFWKMYPSEFAHGCDVSDIPDGRYWGRSTAKIPVTAQLQVKSGRIDSVSFSGPISPYGLRATRIMQTRMIGSSTVGVDIVSGATQTAYAVRSAANAACESARK